MLALTLAITLFVVQVVDATTIKELDRIEQHLGASWKSGDCDGWGAIIDAGWSVIHVTGAVLTKAQALEMCRAGTGQVETFTIDEVSVRLFDDTAVVTGRTIVTTAAPNPETVRLRFTDVFVRRSGKWQVVASQATRLMP